ncbi:hypothetical protein ACFE04_026093 [Oxalis oulophora]
MAMNGDDDCGGRGDIGGVVGDCDDVDNCGGCRKLFRQAVVLELGFAGRSDLYGSVQLLRDRLDEVPWSSGVEVATIDSFQGREANAVIISMVRSNTLGAVGFLGDSRRMNVAITRARKHVAIVCDSSTICHNTFLARLLHHIRHSGRVKHAEPGDSGGYGFGMNPMLPSSLN